MRIDSDPANNLRRSSIARHQNGYYKTKGRLIRAGGLNPSQQMTAVLRLLACGASMQAIVERFDGDDSLVQLLTASLVAFGFLEIKDHKWELTKRGEIRIKQDRQLDRDSRSKLTNS